MISKTKTSSRKRRRTNAEISAIFAGYKQIYDSVRNRRPLEDFKISSKQRVWWRCKNCHQSYLCSIEAKIRSKAKCTICRGLTLQGNEFPILRKIFCQQQNRLPLDAVRRGSAHLYWFRCAECGHKRKRAFKAVLAALRKGKNPPCEHCYRRGGGIRAEMDRRNRQRIAEEGSFADHHPALAREWDTDRNLRSPSEYLPNSGYQAHWVCRAGHRWQSSINDRVKRSLGCRKCGQHISQYEKRVVVELKALGFDVAWNERLGGVECDVLLKKQKVAIEVDGFPWHDSDKAYLRERKKEKALRKMGVNVVRWRCSQLRRRRACSRVYYHEQDNSRTIKQLFQLLLDAGTFSRKEAAKLRQYCASSKGYIAQEHFEKLHNTTATELFRQSIADAYPQLVSSWSERNFPLQPEQVSRGSKRRIWWKCAVDPTHEWQSRPTDRQRYGCPSCNLRRQSRASKPKLKH